MTWLIWDHICYFWSNDLSNKSSILSILWSLSLCCVSIWSISFEFCASNFSIRSDFKLGLIFFFGNSAFVSNVFPYLPFPIFFSNTHWFLVTPSVDLCQKTHLVLLMPYSHMPHQIHLYVSSPYDLPLFLSCGHLFLYTFSSNFSTC